MTRHIKIELADAVLRGDLSVPPAALGLVVFAHGSGSGRHSPRNRFVAERLNAAGLATLLIDLLTEDEERVDDVTRALRFDIPMLAARVKGAVLSLARDKALASLPVGLFGASTGAAAALVAAADLPEVGAVVSRGGRPDLAGDSLRKVHCPTLLIVGGDDELVLELNEQARHHLRGESELSVVPGATHLFEEPGALEQVAELAACWFCRHLRPRARQT